MSAKTESVILSLHPAPPGCPLRVLSIFEIDEWIYGWAEPVILVALVETKDYAIAVDELPGNAIERQDFLLGRERTIEPVIYDSNAMTGLSTWSDLKREQSQNESIRVLRDDISWEELAREVYEAMRSMHWQPRKAEAVR